MLPPPPLPGLGLRPLVMGILNVTPDSFSGDGLLAEKDSVAAALNKTETMLAEGVDLLDIGGESSRPGSDPVSVEEEIRRVVPVIQEIRRLFPSLPLSIDTVRPETARRALDAGVSMINDISGGRQDPAMLELAAERGAYLVLMHNGSNTAAIEENSRLGAAYRAPAYEDAVNDVCRFLNDAAGRALTTGVRCERIVLDPGLGFGKTVEQNLRLMNKLDTLKALGFPVLAGPSRKSFIGRVLDCPVEERLEGTAAAVAACVLRGADIVRVHDVREMSRVVRMAAAIRSAGTDPKAKP